MLETLTGRINLSLAAYPGCDFLEAMQRAVSEKPSEPLLGALALDHTQLCPQNRGVLTPDFARGLREVFPGTRFRLHANVRVLPTRQIADWSSWDAQSPYWRALAATSRLLDAPAYTAHAGRRSEADLATVLESARRAQDVFGCPVGIEGHYPTRSDVFLVSTWEEYRTLFESDVPYAVDLSHLHIVAEQSGRYETTLVQEMLASDRCLEVHLSGNDGTKDQHQPLTEAPWWWPLLAHIHEDAVMFSEGVQ
jgi:hypothetical protein